MKKKILSSVLLLSLALVATGCSKDEEVASIKGESITHSQLYNELKTEYGSATLQTMLVNKTLEKEYGDKVSKDEVDKAYKEIENQYGGEKQLEEVVSMYGYNDLDAYKKAIKQNLLVEAMVKDKVALSDEDYKEYFDNMADFDLIQVEDEAKAKELIAKIEKGEDFNELAYENSVDTYTSSNEGKVGLTDLRNEDTYPKQLMEAVSKMKDGEISKEPIKTDYGVFIVKINTNLKTSDAKIDDYKKQIEEYVMTIKSQDSEFVQTELGKLLKEYKVVIADEDLKDALNSFNISEEVEKTESSK